MNNPRFLLTAIQDNWYSIFDDQAESDIAFVEDELQGLRIIETLNEAEYEQEA